MVQGENRDGESLMCGKHSVIGDLSKEELPDALCQAHQQVLELQAQRKEYHWLEEVLRRRIQELRTLKEGV